MGWRGRPDQRRPEIEGSDEQRTSTCNRQRDGDDAWAAGSFHVAGDPYATRGWLLRWDGSTWQNEPYPAQAPGTIRDITALGPDDVWAFTRNTHATSTGFLHWDGTAWSAIDGWQHPAG